MSSTVCQGLQSCLEPRLVEPGALGLKMVATKPNFLRPIAWARRSPPMIDSDSYLEEPNNENNSNDITFNNICDSKSKDSDNDKKKDNNMNGDLGGWSFIQALNNNSTNPSMEVKKDEKKENLYVHPFIKKLSDKSLEYCTENLGCETGSTTSEDSDISFPSSPSSSYYSSLSDTERCESLMRERASKQVSCRRTANYKSFPPPLTSISGSNRVNISPHREGGRLIMKAAVVPSCNTNFQAERRDGRLILRFLDNSSSSSSSSSSTSPSFDFESAVTKDVENKKKEVEEEEEQEHEHEQEEEEEEEEDDDEVVVEDCGDGDMDGNKCIVGGEIGKRKFQRPSRCMEGGKNKGLLIPHWVATS